MNSTEIYLALNFVVFTVSAAVCIYYGGGIGGATGAQKWLIIGIVIGFAGKILDGVYWQMTWAASLFEFEKAQYLIDMGTAANIPLRQIPIVAAALCHLRGAWIAIDCVKEKRKLAVHSFVCGVLLYISTLAAICLIR